MVTLFPSILPEADFVDDTYLRPELERKEYTELKSIAAEHESDAVHGRMSKEDLVDGLEGLERV